MFTISKCNLIVALAFALVANTAQAEGVLDYGGPGPSPAPPAKPAAPSEKQHRDVIAGFLFEESIIPSGSECENLLVQAGVRLGRFLTYDEIAENLPVILRATGEKLQSILPTPPPSPSPAPSPRSGPVCFTGDMKVLTPRGEVPISQLKPDDEVVSVEQTLGGKFRLVVNRVALNTAYENQSFGLLTDLPRPIKVTPRHEFIATSLPLERVGYRSGAIEDLAPDTSLFFGDEGTWKKGEYYHTPRGNYSYPQGTETVFDLQLIGHPRNYIVEGVLVHNGIKVCIG